MKVDFIDHMGNDLAVVNAARVSFSKVSEELTDKDVKLIKYLAEHDHWSPFAHAYIKFKVKAPIFVARQLQKHTVGLAWNEVSRRYVDDPPEFYLPDTWRRKADNVKQGSSDEIVNLDSNSDAHWPLELIWHCTDTYNSLIKQGVCPEQARMVLPQSMMTEWIWSGSLAAFARVCRLRLDPHTQRETQMIAEQIARHLQHYFPHSYEELIK